MDKVNSMRQTLGVSGLEIKVYSTGFLAKKKSYRIEKLEFLTRSPMTIDERFWIQETYHLQVTGITHHPDEAFYHVTAVGLNLLKTKPTKSNLMYEKIKEVNERLYFDI